MLSPDGVLVVADADIEEQAMRPRRRRWRVGDAHGSQLAALLGRRGLDVIDYRAAPVHCPVPTIHVLTARLR